MRKNCNKLNIWSIENRLKITTCARVAIKLNSLLHWIILISQSDIVFFADRIILPMIFAFIIPNVNNKRVYCRVTILSYARFPIENAWIDWSLRRDGINFRDATSLSCMRNLRIYTIKPRESSLSMRERERKRERCTYVCIVNMPQDTFLRKRTDDTLPDIHVSSNCFGYTILLYYQWCSGWCVPLSRYSFNYSSTKCTEIHSMKSAPPPLHITLPRTRVEQSSASSSVVVRTNVRIFISQPLCSLF